VPRADGESVLDDAAQAVPHLGLEPGGSRAEAPLDDSRAETAFGVVAGRDAVHELRLASRARLEAPKRVAAGSSFQVDWQGPDNKGGYITVVPTDTPEGEYGNYAHTASSSPLDLRAPDAPGATRFAT
jgi:hypothetical protein